MDKKYSLRHRGSSAISYVQTGNGSSRNSERYSIPTRMHRTRILIGREVDPDCQSIDQRLLQFREQNHAAERRLRRGGQETRDTGAN